MADHALQHFGQLRIGGVVHRVHVNARAVLALIIGDLPQERRVLVDGEAGALLDGALALGILRPMLALEELQIATSVIEVIVLGSTAHPKPLFGLPEDVTIFVVAHR